MSYAWIIDVDHVADVDAEPGTNCNAVGRCGPGNAPKWMLQLLQLQVPAQDELDKATLAALFPLLLARNVGGDWATKGVPDVAVYQFRMYDDDNELYYTGRVITSEGQTERACFGPLSDFGGPNAGAANIRFTNHSEMDCG